ncbi:hypothetical protein, partial [Agromyces seonyuensis]|uniref:hypothetical protein n=1 Tax=Agromyces seonyuensis TaxID=2662446 RepID=UPI001F243BA4
MVEGNDRPNDDNETAAAPTRRRVRVFGRRAGRGKQADEVAARPATPAPSGGQDSGTEPAAAAPAPADA